MFKLVVIQSIPTTVTLIINTLSLQNVKWFGGSGRCLEILQKEIERNRFCQSIITSKNSIHIDDNGDESSVSPTSSYLVVADGCLVKSPIDFVPILEICVYLHSIVIGNSCLKKTSTLLINASPQLRTLRVGENSFTFNDVKNQGQLTIRDCPYLVNISIGKGSFCGAKIAYFANLPQLEILEMESTALQKCSEVSVIGCELLSKLSFEKKSFPGIDKLLIQSDKMV